MQKGHYEALSRTRPTEGTATQRSGPWHPETEPSSIRQATNDARCDAGHPPSKRSGSAPIDQAIRNVAYPPPHLPIRRRLRAAGRADEIPVRPKPLPNPRLTTSPTTSHSRFLTLAPLADTRACRTPPPPLTTQAPHPARPCRRKRRGSRRYTRAAAGKAAGRR